MLVLVVGGSASGKSGFAETAAVSLSEGGPLFYLATLDPGIPGASSIIERHLEKRKDKGFITVEAARNIDDNPAFSDAGGATVLLECIPNLLANEMFGKTPASSGDVIREILALSRRVKNLVVVSDLIFSSGESYENETTAYIENLGQIHSVLLENADMAAEVISSCPVYLKGGR